MAICRLFSTNPLELCVWEEIGLGARSYGIMFKFNHIKLVSNEDEDIYKWK